MKRTPLPVYFCVGPHCPGYAARASELAHPTTCAVSGLAHGDASFGIFEQDIVEGRLISSEDERGDT